MENTFWTNFDNKFYRIKDDTLLEKLSKSDGTVDYNSGKITVSISDELLKQINEKFNSKFDIENFS